MSKRGIAVAIVAGLLVVATLAVGAYNIFVNDAFWNVSVAQILTLMVTISIAFWATQIKNDQRSAKAHAEKVIGKIQSIVASENFYTFLAGSNEEETKKHHGIAQRKFSNCLNVLQEYGKQLGFQDDVKYIEDQFKEYKSFVSDHIHDFDYLSKSETHLRKLSENIDSKCDQIIVKLYK